jgi:DNA-binding beta-propeller fold protein YncE
MSKRAKGGVLALTLLTLCWLAPVSLHAADKKKKAAPAAAPVAKEVIPDFTKIAFPLPPAVPRVRYLDYFSAQLPEMTGEKKEQKKSGWMDRLAGVDQAADAKKGKKPRFQLLAPYGVAVDSKGLLYVADTKVGAIFIFNTETDDLTLIKNGVDAHFKSILGLAMDDSDHLYVTDNGTHEVMEFDANHKFVGSFGGTELRNPCGIALDQENRFLYVADVELDQIVVFDADTHAVLRKIGTTGKNHTLTDPGNFSKPTNVAVDKDGNLFVTDTLNDRVEVFDADGNFIRTFGKNGDAAGDFARPKGIAIDCDGHVWVADAMLNRLQVFTPEGQILLAFGSYGIEPAEFQALTGLAYDKQRNRIFSAEQIYSRVQMFRYYTDDEARAELAKRKAGNKPADSKDAAAPATPTAPVVIAPSVEVIPVKEEPAQSTSGSFSTVPSAAGQAKKP